jgi:hypothetical protein
MTTSASHSWREEIIMAGSSCPGVQGKSLGWIMKIQKCVQDVRAVSHTLMSTDKHEIDNNT